MSRLPVLALNLGLVLLACKPPPADRGETLEPAASPLAEPEPPPTSGAVGSGSIYFAIASKGLVEFDGTAFAMVDVGRYYSVNDLLTGPDGTVYALSQFDLSKIEDGKLVPVLPIDHQVLGRVEYLTFGEPGQYFTGSYTGVGEWRGDGWTVLPREAIGPEVKLLNGVTLGPDRKLWVASTHDLHFRDASGSWQRFDVGVLGSKPYFQALQTSPTGDIYAVASDFLARITFDSEPPKIEKIVIPGTKVGLYEDLMFSADGHVGVGSSVCMFARIDPAAPASPWIREDDFGCEGMTAVALDGRKRMWVASRTGLDVLGPEHEHVVYPSGSVPELVGTVDAIAVVGLGPDSLPVAGPVKTASVTGKLFFEGRPRAGAKLEICPQPTYALRRTDSPCAGSKAKFGTTSEKDGTFTLHEVPLGNYVIAVEIDGEWWTTSLNEWGVAMQEGQTHDVGDVKFSTEFRKR